MKDKIIKYIKDKYYGILVLPELDVIEYTAKLIDDYHLDHELDMELVIHESLILLTPPLVDYPKSLELLKKIYTYKTSILRAIIQYTNMGFIEENINDLSYFLSQELDTKSKSIICFLLALAEDNDINKTEYLVQSISFNPNNVLSYIELYEICVKQKEFEKSSKCLRKGLHNVKRVIKENDKINIADYDFFVRETIIGDVMTEERFDYWKEVYEKQK